MSNYALHAKQMRLPGWKMHHEHRHAWHEDLACSSNRDVGQLAVDLANLKSIKFTIQVWVSYQNSAVYRRTVGALLAAGLLPRDTSSRFAFHEYIYGDMDAPKPSTVYGHVRVFFEIIPFHSPRYAYNEAKEEIHKLDPPSDYRAIILFERTKIPIGAQGVIHHEGGTYSVLTTSKRHLNQYFEFEAAAILSSIGITVVPAAGHPVRTILNICQYTHKNLGHSIIVRMAIEVVHRPRNSDLHILNATPEIIATDSRLAKAIDWRKLYPLDVSDFLLDS